AFDRSGRSLARIDRLFHNLIASETSPALQAVEREMAPRFAAHYNNIFLDAGLFGRIDTLHRLQAALQLDAESRQLLARVHLDFVRAGAQLSPSDKLRMAQIGERLAALTTQFSQNLLADESGYELVLREERD